MPQNAFDFGFNLGKIKPIGFGLAPQKKKRVKLTPGERVKVWENPRLYGRKCNICGGRITKLSDLTLDHTRPYSNGGQKMNLAHKDCNSIKGSRNLKYVQKKMVFKSTTKKKNTIRKKKTTKQKLANPFEINIPKFKF